MRLRTLCLTLLAFALVPVAAHAGNTVSSFTIAPSPVIGNSTSYATGNIVVQRDPNSPNGNIGIGLDFTGPVGGYECEPNHQGVYFQGCYILDGETSTTVKLWGSCVSSATGATVKAHDLGNPQDLGVTAGMTVTPLPMTLNMPSLLHGGTGETGGGSVGAGTTLRLGITAYFSSNPAVPLTYNPPATYGIGIPAGASHTDFTVQAGTVSTNTDSTVTATNSCGVPASAPVTVLAGGVTDLGVCKDCKARSGDPINLTNGNVWVRRQEYALPGLGGGLEVTRTWNSLWEKITNIELVGAFGRGWRSTYEERIGALSGGYRKYWREDGSAWVFKWDSINQGYLLVSPPDERASLSYDSGTTLYTLTFLDGSKKIFNSGGYLTSIVDRNGNTTTITLTTVNGSTRPYQVTDAAGRWVRFNYDAYARITTLQDATGTIATYSWNGFNLSRATYPDASYISYSYDASNRLLNATDTNGKVLESHTYDGSNRGLTSARANGVDAASVSYTSNSSTRLTDSLGNVTDYGFAPQSGRQFITSITGSGCSSCGGRGNSSYTYDAAGNQTSSTDALGRTTTYTYDSNGNVLTRTLAGATWSYTYNGFGEVLTATDPLGHTTTNTYDSKGNLLSTTTPSPDGGTTPGSTTSFAYDVKGQLISITDPLSNPASIFYTAAGLIDHITDAQSNTASFAYDARGNRTSVTDALSHATTFTYNNMNRLTRITYPDTTHTDFAYDNRGRRTSVTDQNGKVTSYAYDDADRLITVTDAQTPTHGVAQYAYDTENNLAAITDALSRVTSFTYDGYGRVTRTTFPSTLYETYSYDAVGNLLSKTDRKSQTISYFYDPFDRLTRKQYPDSTTVDYTYDLAGRLTNVSDATGTYDFAYDNMGRLTGTTTSYSFLTARTFTSAYQYDAASNRTRFTDSEGGQNDYIYDTLNRLTSLTNFNSQTFGFSYDQLGRRTQLTRPNGVNTNYTYDNLSRLLSVLHQVGATTIDGATYTVDAVGNRASKTNQLNAVTENYGYDAIYQLLQVTQGANTTESYSYDLAGNRLSSLGVSPYSYNNSNQLTSTPTATYTYDNNGNTLTKLDVSGTTTYAWDFENRMVSVTVPGSGGTVSFKYDPFGRRIQKGSASGTTTYVYDGTDITEEVDAAGSVLARYSAGEEVDEPLAMLRGGATSYYQADGLGSVTSLTDGSGAVVATYTYDSFGKSTQSTGTALNPFRYTGRELDSEIGLYYYRARYYDPNTARFLSEDLVRFREGVNFYSYVGGSPTNATDPSGLWSTEAHDQIIWNALHACGVSNESIWQIQQGSRYADRKEFQAPEYSYMHAMRDGTTKQSSAAAKNQTAMFIANRMQIATDKMNAGAMSEAMFAFGVAMHPVMDGLSPAHTDANGNPIPWCGLAPWSCSNLSQHVSPTSIEDLNHLNSRPDLQERANVAIRNYFQALTGKKVNCCQK